MPPSEEQIAHLIKRMDTLMEAMEGDPFDPKKPGFMAIMYEMHKDYYGDDETKRIGTKHMVLKMWDDWRKVIGGTMVLSAAISVLAWGIEQWISAHH